MDIFFDGFPGATVYFLCIRKIHTILPGWWIQNLSQKCTRLIKMHQI